MNEKNNIETVLIIGAGPAQIKGIKIAKKFGFYTVAVDGDPNAEGLSIADKGIHADITQHSEIIKIARQTNAKAAISVSSEICLPTVAAVNKAIGFDGLTPDQVLAATDKSIMRKAFLKSGIPGPDFVVASKHDNPLTKTQSLKFPVVVKPVDSSGSKGVSCVETPEGIKNSVANALRHSNSGKVIIEEFMAGAEIAVDGFIVNGTFVVLSFSDKTRTPAPYFLDTSVIFPSNQPTPVLNKAKQIISKAVSALTLDNTPIHAELIVGSNGEVNIVELAARGPGFNVYTEMIPYATGIDPVKLQFKQIKGDKIDITPPLKYKGACIKFFSGHSGILKSIEGLDKAREIANIYDLKIYVKPGDKINDLTCGADRIGHVIAFAESRDEAVSAANFADKLINFEIV